MSNCWKREPEYIIDTSSQEERQEEQPSLEDWTARDRENDLVLFQAGGYWYKARVIKVQENQIVVKRTSDKIRIPIHEAINIRPDIPESYY